MSQKTRASNLVTLSVYTPPFPPHPPPPPHPALPGAHAWPRLYEHSLVKNFGNIAQFYVFFIKTTSWMGFFFFFKSPQCCLLSGAGGSITFHPLAHVALPLHEIFIKIHRHYLSFLGDKTCTPANAVLMQIRLQESTYYKQLTFVLIYWIVRATESLKPDPLTSSFLLLLTLAGQTWQVELRQSSLIMWNKSISLEKAGCLQEVSWFFCCNLLLVTST